MVEHFTEKAGSVGTAGETKHVYIITRVVVAHQEAVPPHDVLVEAFADGGVDGFLVGGFEARRDTFTSPMNHSVGGEVGTDTRCVV